MSESHPTPPVVPPPATIPFTPVPGRARHDGWTPARQQGFVVALAITGAVGAAARSVGMSARSAYGLRRRAGEDSAFAGAWDAALSTGEDLAISQAMDVALTGRPVPVFYRGRQVGERRVFDDRILIGALKAMAGRDRYQIGPLHGSSRRSGDWSTSGNEET